jgi:hypothetical protein
VGQLLVDNGGLSGTNTPLSSAYDIPALPFNLTIGGGAVACPQSSLALSNLNITGGSFITSLPGLSGLELVVFGNANVAAGGGIVADAKGFAQASGPGAGQSVGGSGSGAGYGGLGGASATAPGGTNYGSAQCPVDQGSGGGFGSGMTYGGSEGGGAIRLNVGGVLTVDGRLSANGNWGIQDNSGGGSGGSIWVTTGTLAGNGQIVADGGEGELFGGGGGGGGRIALYSRVNVFAGLVSVFGGEGDFRGADGSIFNATNPVIQGAVTSTNGQPVSGILIQPDGGLFATTTDTNGNYVLEILPGWSGTVVPSGSGFVFAPGSRIYTNTTASISNQNYVATITIAPAVSAGLQATNLMMNWFGISGVTYQLYFSSNLVDWLPYGDAFPGTNGPVVLPVPTTGDPARFFRVRASN